MSSRPVRTLVPQVRVSPDLPPALGHAEGLQVVRELISRPRVVVITGAGISTESGIPDYRGPSGRARNATPMSYQDFMATPQARQRYWARSFAGWPVMGLSAPNAGHRALAKLQRLGALDGLITQNVDQLHVHAGSTSIVELHGSLARVICQACGAVSRRSHLQDRLAEANPGLSPASLAIGDDAGEVKPDGDRDVVEAAIASFATVGCVECGHDALKPDVVFFGESVPKPRVQTCVDWVDRASGLLVLGSSLAVMSAYRFVRQARRRDVPVVIVNQGVTRGDADASARVNAPLGQFLTDVATWWDAHHTAG